METLIEVKNLNMHYTVSSDFFQKKNIVYAINNLNLTIYKNEILGLVGESGCGKSTLGNCILNLLPVTSGEVLYKGKNILNANKNYIKNFRKHAQLIFQNPYMSLNPRMNVYDILREPFIVNGIRDKKIIQDGINKIINLIGFTPDILERFPHEFSGGQRQRIAIARAIILNPEFVVADEPVSALDVSIQAQIINLLLDLKNHLNLTMLFVSHDLNIIRYVSDRVAVMYLGEIIEIADKKDIFSNPKHPYTKALLSVIPKINNKENNEKIFLNGDLPSPQHLPNGCKFHTRCPYAIEKCKTEIPKGITNNNHFVKCFLCEK